MMRWLSPYIALQLLAITTDKEVIMSEIKGQLLGIVLVAIIFGTVATALGVLFANLTDKVEEKVTSIVNKDYGPAAAIDKQLQNY